jgi:hypothetical protein
LPLQDPIFLCIKINPDISISNIFDSYDLGVVKTDENGIIYVERMYQQAEVRRGREEGGGRWEGEDGRGRREEGSNSGYYFLLPLPPPLRSRWRRRRRREK